MLLDPYSYFGEVVRVEDRGEMLLTETVYDAGMRLPCHSHGSSHLAVLLDGAYLERIGDHAYLCLPGDAVHYLADVQHENLFGNGTGRCLNLEFAPGAEPEVCRQSACLSPAEVMALVRSRGQTSEVEAPKWIGEARRIIDERPSTSLTPLAEELSVHPSYLARCFRAAYSISVGQYAKLARVRLAAKLMLESPTSLAEIAYDSGFFDQSHLTNTFQRLTGFTPAALRHVAHG